MVMAPLLLILSSVPCWASAGAAVNASEASAAMRMRAETAAVLVRSMAGTSTWVDCSSAALGRCRARPLTAARIPGAALEDNNGLQGEAMNFPDEEQKQALLEQAMQLATRKLDPKRVQETREFLSLYYRQVDAEDLA